MSSWIPARARVAVALLLLTIGSAAAASAATAKFQILLDLDNNPSTGCDVPTLSVPFKGVEQILITTVTSSGTTAQVTALEMQTCTGSSFGPVTAVAAPAGHPLPWPVGTNGVTNPSVIETFFPLSLSTVANPLIVRLGVLGFDNGGVLTDEMLTTAPGSGFPILLQAASIAEIPTLTEWGLGFLGLVLALSAVVLLRRRRTAGTVLLALLLLGAAGVAFAAAGSCDLDGTTTDEWSSANLLATDGSDTTGADLRALYGFKDAAANALCFRIDALLQFDTKPVAVDDSYTIVQDTTLNVPAPGVLGNDQGGNLTATPQAAAATAQGGSVTLAVDGGFSYTPAAGFVGTDSFTYTANNGLGTDDGTVTITVTDVNQAPSFTKGPDQTVLEDAFPETVVPNWATAISPGPPSESGQTVTFLVTNDTNPSLFSVAPAVSSTGTLTFTPAPDANGTATITLVAKDDGGTANGGVDTSAPQTFVINVTAVNDAPSFTKGADQTVLENAGPQTVNGWATAISPGPPDESGQTVSFNVTGNSNPALFAAGPAVSPTGVLTYTPATNQFGTATITIDLQDDGGTANGGVDTSAPQTFVIDVGNINQPPSFTKGPDQTVLEDAGAQTVNGWATAISAGPGEGSQTVTFQVTNNTNPALFSAGPAVSSTGTLTYTPAANANGTATITLVAKDDGGTANGGVDTSAPQTFVINVTAVNDAPSFTKGPDQTVLENAGPQTVNGWATAISAGPPDESSQTLTFQVTNNSNPSLFSAGPAVSPTGVLTFTPATNQFGTATITLVLKDDGGTANSGVDTSAPQTFVINVSNVNQPPSFTKGPDQTVLEDAGAQTVPNWATAISAGPGEGTQTVSFQVTNNTNPSLFSAGPAVSSTGTLTYTPAANANGTATITLVLKDDGGTANGGVDTSAPQTFVINVTAVNDAPSFTKGPDQAVLENAGPQTVNPWATAISAGPPDESGQTLTFQVTNNTNPSLFSAAPAVSPTGVLTFTPAANQFGTATITLVLKDNGGTANSGVDTSAPQTFVIDVNNVNQAPSFTKGADQTVLEDAGPQTVPNWATAISAGPNEGTQTVNFQVTGNTNPSLFSAGPAVSPTGTLTYTPAANANGTATITLVLKDNGGTANGGVDTSAPQTFVINVTAVNDAPSFTKGPDQTVLENAGPQTVNPWATAISAGPPDESGQTLTFQVTGNTNPGLFSAGPAVSPAGVLTFTPATNTAGTATITIVLKDNGGTANGGVDTSAPQTVVINVTAVNQAPSFTKGPDETVLENSGPQTFNPWATAISPGPANESGQTVTFIVTNNTNPSLFSAGPAVSPTGVLTFTPAAGAFGTATITLVLKDNGGTANGGQDTSAPQTFVIDVTQVNQAPSFTKGPDETVLEDAGPQTISPWATAISAGPPSESGQTLVFNVTGNTNPSLFSAGPAVSPTGVLTFTPAPNANGTATITLVLKDNGGTANGGQDTSAPQTFVINVTSVNDQPSFTKGADQSVGDNAGPVTVNPWATGISAGPANESGQTLTFNITANDNPSIFAAGPSVSPTGVLTFTPAIVPFGTFTATITLVLMDNGGTANGGVDTSAPQMFKISITHVNIPPQLVGSPKETFDTVGNVQLQFAAAPSINTPKIFVTGNLKDNFTDSDNGPSSLTAVPIVAGPTANGGKVDLQSTGEFIYTPKAGDTAASDTFTYQVTDGAATTAPRTVTINLKSRVWFVKNDAPGGQGRSNDPFNTLAGAQTASLAGDYIFVYFGDGTTTSQNAGIALKDGQHLIGEFSGLTVTFSPAITFNGVPGTTSVQLLTQPAPTACSGNPCRPMLDNPAAGGNAVSATDVIPAEIAGLNLAGNTNGIDVTHTAAFAGSGSTDIRDNVVRSAGVEGIDINKGGSGSLNLSVRANAVTATGNGIDILRSNGSLFITAFNDNVVTGNTAGSGIVVNGPATFDSDPVAANLQPVSGGVTVIGQPGNPVGSSQANGGLVLNQVTGSLSFTDLDIYSAGYGLAVGGTGVFTGAAGTSIQVTPAPPDSTGSSTIVANDGAAVAVSSATVDLRLAGLTSTPTTFSTSGVDFATVAGQFRAPSGSSINKSSGPGVAFHVDNSAAGTTALTSVYAGTISNSSTSARSILITNADSGSSFSFSGTVTDSGQGVSLTNNTGATIDFTSALTLSTGANAAFTATGGGTVTATDMTSTITTTTGTALNVANTTIGAGGLKFRSISAGTAASGPTNGIVLNSTGTSGTLTVAGTGSAGTGGTIQKTGAEGILITGPANASFSWMSIQNPGTHGISSTTANNLTVANTTITDAAGNNTTDDGLHTSNTTGTLTITSCTINGARHQGVTIDNFNTNMAALNMTGTTVTNTPGGDGMLMQMRGTSVLTTGTISNNTFSSNSATGLQVNNADTGNISSLTVQSNTVTGNNAGMDFDLSQASSMTIVVQSNTITNSHTQALNLVTSTSATGGSMTATLRNNNIGTAGVNDSGSAIGNGIRVANGGLNVSLTIDGNIIREVPNGRGIDIEAQAYIPNLNLKAKIINNQIVRPSGTNQNIGCGANVPCPSASIFVLSDSNGLGGFDHVCTVITGNSAYDPTSWPAGGEAAFYFARRTSASNTLSLEGTQPNVTNQIQSTNTVTNLTSAGVIDENTSGTVAIVPAGTCGGFPP